METRSTGFYRVATSMTAAEVRRGREANIRAAKTPLEDHLRWAEKQLCAILRTHGVQVRMNAAAAMPGWEQMVFGAVKVPDGAPPIVGDAVKALIDIHAFRKFKQAGQDSLAFLTAVNIGGHITRMGIRPLELWHKAKNSRGGTASSVKRRQRAEELAKRIRAKYAEVKRRYDGNGVSDAFLIANVADQLKTSDGTVRNALKAHKVPGTQKG